MWQNIIIVVIIVVCVIYIGRRFYRDLTGKSSGCGCNCTGCDVSKSKGKPTDKTGGDGCCPS